MEFNELKIKKIVLETEDTKSYYFNVPEHLKSKYRYKAGQYITIDHEVNGEDVRRAYSICTAPESGEMAVTIKRVKNGKMSNFFFEKINEGDQVKVAAPEGRFIVEPDHEKGRDHYFIVAGSGITPVMSMVTTILEEEPKSACYVLYGSRNEDQIIFQEGLSDLEKQYADQLFIIHTLSQPKKRKQVDFLDCWENQLSHGKERQEGSLHTK